MLYASIKISTSFSHKIGGFNYAALAPAFGAGLAGKFGGFLTRQTLGSLGMTKAAAWDDRAKKEANKPSPNKLAQRMYELGAAGAKRLGTRDYNFMGTQLGKEIGKVAAGKDFGGKAVGGFEATQKKFIEKQEALAKKQAYTEQERQKIVEKGMAAAMEADRVLGDKYKDKESEHKVAKEEDAKVRKESQMAQDAIVKKFEKEMTDLRVAVDGAKTAYEASGSATDKATLDKARGELKEVERSRRAELSFEQEKIRNAERRVNTARHQFLDVAEEVRVAAETAGHIPKQFKKPSEIAEENIKSSSIAFLHANNPTPAGVDKLADKVAKQLGKEWGKDERSMTKNIVKQLTEKAMDRDEK
jgi:hypothetical protein